MSSSLLMELHQQGESDPLSFLEGVGMLAVLLLSNIHAHCSDIPLSIIGLLYEVMFHYLTAFILFI